MVGEVLHGRDDLLDHVSQKSVGHTHSQLQIGQVEDAGRGHELNADGLRVGLHASVHQLNTHSPGRRSAASVRDENTIRHAANEITAQGERGRLAMTGLKKALHCTCTIIHR